MPISLQKGQKVSLVKDGGALNKMLIGLGWDTNKYSGGAAFDLDASAFLVADNGKVTADTDFVFYGNLSHPSGAVTHLGDNRTGEGEGDDEQIDIVLSSLPANITKIAITVTIYESEKRGQNFGQVSNAFIRIVDNETSEELIRYDLGEDFSIETAVVVGEIYKYNNEWKFSAVGAGFSGGLHALCGNYGIDVE